MKADLIKGMRAGSNWLRKSGILIDLENKKYFEYESIFGIKSGVWKKLPDIDYLLLFRTVYVRCEDCSLEDFDKGKGHYQLSLVHKQRRIIVHESKNRQEVFDFATRLSKQLQLPLRDSATNRRAPQWLQPAA
ncbi:MAG TPA: hypothetical protein PLQ93_11695 [Bacteroidia bacterium]|nr:hypothetical protein [Bacteroidia bacterium]